MTIAEAAKAVLQQKDSKMLPQEIFEEINKQGLYQFGASNPVAVLSNTLRKNSDARSGNLSPFFHRHEDGSYSIK